jgi:hypothetical protein
MRTSPVAASWIFLLACLMATTKRFSGYDRAPSILYGQVALSSLERAKNLRITSTAIFEATSPLAWAPIPSATRKSCSSSMMQKESSLWLYFSPGSVLAA